MPRLSSLTVSKRQMVDIAKAVSYNCDIIALDEPTSSLNEKEVDILMEIIDGLRRQGKGIIYISHKMEEIFRIADDITVMRDGALIKTMRAAETNVDEVIRLMVGRELTDRFPPKQGTIGKEILVVKDLNDLATTSMIFPSTCMKARSWALRACWARAVPSCWKRCSAHAPARAAP